MLLATAVAAVIVVGGVFAYQAWQDDDDDAPAAPVAPGPATTAPAAAPDQGSFLFRRVTADGIEVRARLNEGQGRFGGVIMDAEVAVGDVPTTEAAVEVEGLRRLAPPTTVPTDDATVETVVAEPIPVDPGIGGPAVDQEDLPEECVVEGDLQAWAISSESVAQGGSPWMKISPEELYPQLLWDGLANQGDADAVSLVGVTLQVPDDVTSVQLRTTTGAMDEMEPVEGAVVLAVNVSGEAVQDVLNGGMNDPAARHSIQITARRADGSVLTASAVDAMNKPHPAWSVECQPEMIIEPLPPELEPPTLPEPGEVQPADPATARAEVERNFGSLYGPRDPAIDRSLYIDDNYGMAEASESVEQNFPGAADGASVAIDELVFVDASNAVFRYTLTTPNATFSDQLGRARLCRRGVEDHPRHALPGPLPRRRRLPAVGRRAVVSWPSRLRVGFWAGIVPGRESSRLPGQIPPRSPAGVTRRARGRAGRPGRRRCGRCAEAAADGLAALVVRKDVQPVLLDGIDGEGGDAVDVENTTGHLVVAGALVGDARRGGVAVVGLAVALGMADVGADPHRTEHRHADLVLAQLPPQHLGERDDAVLGDAVRPEAAVRHETGERRREQDVAPLALLDEAGQERLDAVDRSPEVDVDRPAPVVVGHLEHRSADSDAGVVEHDVHPPDGRTPRRPRAVDGVERADVATTPWASTPVVWSPSHGGVERTSSTSASTTRPPRAPSTFAVASPIPLAPPVTTAPLPLQRVHVPILPR